MSETVEIALVPEQFGRIERRIVRFGAIEVSGFAYPSGVAALRVVNGAGEMVVLPFQGQQVWDATFNGRRLTMGSMFDQPRPTQDYMGTYGALLIHCGASAMGNPGPEDQHPLHGELPNARYDDAFLRFGRDGRGAFVLVGGSCRQTRAFSHDYRARPTLTLYEGASEIEVEMRIDNLKRSPMELMYLAHINFRPADGGVLLDTAPDGGDGISVRKELPARLVATDAFRALFAAVLADPPSHREVPPAGAVDPELVLSLNCRAGADGWALAMQRHADGTADVVRFRPDELPRGIRWIVRGPDQDAMGLLLPATGDADGLDAARRRGELRIVPPGESFLCRYGFGLAAPAEADAAAARIEQIRGLARHG